MKRLLARLRDQSGLIKIGALLIPLSIVPLLAITPAVRSEYRSFVASLQPREPLPAPRLSLDPVEAGSWRPLPEYDGAVPVLMYRGINSTGDRWSVTQKQFATQMVNDHQAGINEAMALAKRLGVKPEASDTSKSLQAWDVYRNDPV